MHSYSFRKTAKQPLVAVLLGAALLVSFLFPIAVSSQGRPATTFAGIEDDSCGKLNANGCANLALKAMGGRERLEGIRIIRSESVGHTSIMEQSYRQDPFITSYQHLHETFDLAGQRSLQDAQVTWPESDLGHSENRFTLVVGSNGGVYRGRNADRPCSIADVDALRETLELGPARYNAHRLLRSSDLHFEKPEMIRSTPHIVLAFMWGKTPVRILINPFNHLPDAVETVQVFQDYWVYWGDVRQRIYFDNWMLIHGIVYPTNVIEERNGTIWKSMQMINVEFNVPVDEKQFTTDEKVAEQCTHTNWFTGPFAGGTSQPLAPGVDLFLGGWNATIIRQDDGIVILEAPMSSEYVQGVINKARQLYPDIKIKAVLSTSDSWPHVGGVRQAVADGLPIYILDLNRPLLERFVNEPHALIPDSLAQSAKRPDWRIVSGKMDVGKGENRLELYPLRGAGTERQYMVYFPVLHILYASDTLVINADGSLYDPELTFEVFQAVKREGLDVTTVFAMHQAPVPWTQVVDLIQKAQK